MATTQDLPTPVLARTGMHELSSCMSHLAWFSLSLAASS